jgi:asparagine synthase (glutamine-hydrolysing)
MCGIAGIYAYDSHAPPVDGDELLRVRERMIARGPDGAGVWLSDDRRIGLAHRRLSILDLSAAGAQPMAAAGTLQIVFNGEIYNYRELRRDLEARGHRFRSSSDTEVLLHLYAEHGPEMVHLLRGMFAFAIWDEPRRRLFLARDPFGVKPLYFAAAGGSFRFASQVKALIAGGGVDRMPDPAGEVGFFLWGHVPEPYTLFRGIRALPAGSAMVVDETGSRQWRYFDLADEFRRAPEQPLERAEMQARLRELLTDSVRHHFIADVPVGVFLSAGIDSMVLLALARETEFESPHAVTLAFDEFSGSANDETPLALLGARHYDARHEVCRISRQDFARSYPSFMAAMDQPTIDGLNSYFVCMAAARSGIKAVLSGLGGDELFGGYASFRDIPRMVRTCAPFSSLPLLGRGFRSVSAPLLKHFTSPKFAGLLEYGGSYGGAYLLRKALYMPWELPEFLDPDLVREGWRELQPLVRLGESCPAAGTDRQTVAALELSWYMRNQLLRDVDWAAMAHSVEVRVPYVDIELFRGVVPLMAATPPPGKADLAAVPARRLPDEVINRSKTGFNIPLREWVAAERVDTPQERGLRGWAKTVFADYNGDGGL